MTSALTLTREWAYKEIDDLRASLAAVMAERDGLAERIAFGRDEWSPFGARMCPLCVYDDGRFVRRCKIHEWADAKIAQVLAGYLPASLRARAEAEAKVIEVAKRLEQGEHGNRAALLDELDDAVVALAALDGPEARPWICSRCSYLDASPETHRCPPTLPEFKPVPYPFCESSR